MNNYIDTHYIDALDPKYLVLLHKACLCSTLACLPSIFHFWPTTYPACTHKKILEPQLQLLSSGCMELPSQRFTE